MATKSENREWLPVRIILSLVLIVVMGFIIFGKCGDTITRDSLACVWTGSIFDIVGLIIFIAALVWLSGLADAISGKAGAGSVYDKVENKKGMGNAGIIGIVGAAIGFGLIYMT